VVVVLDASVLINFIHADCLDILGRLSNWTFVLPEQVEQEVTRPEQARVLKTAIVRGFIRRQVVSSPRALACYAELLGTGIGKGEASCLAIAIEQGWIVASDERGRFFKVACERVGSGRLVNTPGLLLWAIRSGVISIAEADRIKVTLEARRFRMTFASFRDIVAGQ
jgi:predicted nucleic acid-binding protein